MSQRPRVGFTAGKRLGLDHEERRPRGLAKGVEPKVRTFLKEGGSYPESETQRNETENAKVQSKETLRGQTTSSAKPITQARGTLPSLVGFYNNLDGWDS